MTCSPVKLVQSIIYPCTSTFLSHLISSHSCTYQICFPSTSVLFLPAIIWKLAGIQLDSDQFVAPNVDDLFTSAAMETSKSYPLPILPVHFLRLEEVPMYPGKEDGGHTMSGGTSHVFDRYCTHGILGGVLLYDFCVDWNRSIKSEETLGGSFFGSQLCSDFRYSKSSLSSFPSTRTSLLGCFCLDVLILEFNGTKTPIRVKNPGWKKDHFFVFPLTSILGPYSFWIPICIWVSSAVGLTWDKTLLLKSWFSFEVYYWNLKDFPCSWNIEIKIDSLLVCAAQRTMSPGFSCSNLSGKGGLQTGRASSFERCCQQNYTRYLRNSWANMSNKSLSWEMINKKFKHHQKNSPYRPTYIVDFF